MKPFFLLMLFFASILFPAFGQEISEMSAEVHQSLSTYSRIKPTEKAYLHLNKKIFSPGETIWFKAYMTQGSLNIPGSFSNLLHVQLLNPLHKLKATRYILITEGAGVGDIKLSDSLPPGKYQLKAYTRYMLNSDTAFIYNEAIQIVKDKGAEHLTTKVDPVAQETQPLTEYSPPFSLQFFPEGGEMVDGLKSRIAVKAEDAHGKGIDVRGKIINSSGDTISWFKTPKFGFGDFILTPSSAEPYYAAVVNYQGQDFTFKLPTIKEGGFGMSIQNHENKLYIEATHTNPKSVEGAFILGHLRGRPFAVIEPKEGAEKIYTALSKEGMPSGVAHFTLFNKHGVPQSERLVFIDTPMDCVSLTIKPEKRTYSPREKAGFSLNLQNHEDTAITGSVSVTAIEKSLAETFRHTDNIKSFFLLTSDLKGRIQNPGYYFNSSNKDRHYLLDLLLLTHGWRRFSWKEVLEKPANPPAYIPELGFTIQGKIFNYYRKNKEIAGTVKLMMLENPLFSKTDTTSEQGLFSFDNLHFADTATFLLQANKLGKKDKEGNDNIYIKLDSSEQLFPEPLSVAGAIPLLPEIKDSLYINYQQKAKKIKQIDSAYTLDKRMIMLEEVAVESSRNRENDPFAEAGRLYGEPSARLVLDSLFTALGSQNVFDIIQGRVAGLKVAGTGFDKRALIRGGAAFYILDGMPVDAQVINTLPTQSIAYIDIVKGPKTSIFGSRGANGVVAVYTKKGTGQESENSDVPGIISFRHPGYYLAREFYTPDYEKADLQHAKPDYRSSLYWNPDVVIDEDGKAEIAFYTSDEKEDYLLLIEGITPDGKFITAQQAFSVK